MKGYGCVGLVCAMLCAHEFRISCLGSIMGAFTYSSKAAPPVVPVKPRPVTSFARPSPLAPVRGHSRRCSRRVSMESYKALRRPMEPYGVPHVIHGEGFASAISHHHQEDGHTRVKLTKKALQAIEDHLQHVDTSDVPTARSDVVAQHELPARAVLTTTQ